MGFPALIPSLQSYFHPSRRTLPPPPSPSRTLHSPYRTCSSSYPSKKTRLCKACNDSQGGPQKGNKIHPIAPPASSASDNVTVKKRSDVGTYERLFSNLNEASLEHEPGNLSNAILLIAGTTVGAGILALPAVTQEAGFLASSFTCIGCWVYMVVTGLLVAEVNILTMCELGSGGVSLVSMAMRTLGQGGVLAACGSYLFIHYALLVAYVARSSDILTSILGIPQWLSAGMFSFIIGGLCYSGSQRFIGAVNGILVAGIISSFAVLVFAASGDLDWKLLLKADLAAVPQSIPIIALSFVYQNVVPVVCTDLEGDTVKISDREAMCNENVLFLCFLLKRVRVCGRWTAIG